MAALLALIRGINVGGRKLPMAQLRTVASELGFGEARTYIQTGNVIYDHPGLDPGHVAMGLESAIAGSFGLEVRVITRTRPQLESIVEANPLLDRDQRPSRLHVFFLDEMPAPARVDRLDPERSPDDTFVVVGREVFVHYPDGQGRSKLTLDYLEKTLGTPGTARNWNTTTKLLELMGT